MESKRQFQEVQPISPRVQQMINRKLADEVRSSYDFFEAKGQFTEDGASKQTLQCLKRQNEQIDASLISQPFVIPEIRTKRIYESRQLKQNFQRNFRQKTRVRNDHMNTTQDLGISIDQNLSTTTYGNIFTQNEKQGQPLYQLTLKTSHKNKRSDLKTVTRNQRQSLAISVSPIGMADQLSDSSVFQIPQNRDNFTVPHHLRNLSRGVISREHQPLPSNRTQDQQPLFSSRTQGDETIQNSIFEKSISLQQQSNITQNLVIREDSDDKGVLRKSLAVKRELIKSLQLQKDSILERQIRFQLDLKNTGFKPTEFRQFSESSVQQLHKQMNELVSLAPQIHQQCFRDILALYESLLQSWNIFYSRTEQQQNVNLTLAKEMILDQERQLNQKKEKDHDQEMLIFTLKKNLAALERDCRSYNQMPGLECDIGERTQVLHGEGGEGKQRNKLSEMQQSMKQAYLRSKIASETDALIEHEEGFFDFASLQESVAKNYQQVQIKTAKTVIQTIFGQHYERVDGETQTVDFTDKDQLKTLQDQRQVLMNQVQNFEIQLKKTSEKLAKSLKDGQTQDAKVEALQKENSFYKTQLQEIKFERNALELQLTRIKKTVVVEMEERLKHYQSLYEKERDLNFQFQDAKYQLKSKVTDLEIEIANLYEEKENTKTLLIQEHEEYEKLASQVNLLSYEENDKDGAPISDTMRRLQENIRKKIINSLLGQILAHKNSYKPPEEVLKELKQAQDAANKQVKTEGIESRAKQAQKLKWEQERKTVDDNIEKEKIAKILAVEQAREQAKQARENKKSEKMAEEVKAADRTQQQKDKLVQRQQSIGPESKKFMQNFYEQAKKKVSEIGSQTDISGPVSLAQEKSPLFRQSSRNVTRRLTGIRRQSTRNLKSLQEQLADQPQPFFHTIAYNARNTLLPQKQSSAGGAIQEESVIRDSSSSSVSCFTDSDFSCQNSIAQILPVQNGVSKRARRQDTSDQRRLKKKITPPRSPPDQSLSPCHFSSVENQSSEIQNQKSPQGEKSAKARKQALIDDGQVDSSKKQQIMQVGKIYADGTHGKNAKEFMQNLYYSMDQQSLCEERRLKTQQTKLNEKIDKLTNYRPILITNGVNRIDGPSQREVEAKQFKLKQGLNRSTKRRSVPLGWSQLRSTWQFQWRRVGRFACQNC